VVLPPLRLPSHYMLKIRSAMAIFGHGAAKLIEKLY
jgi:hypothetical protein